MPPLRERGDDVLLLAHHFVERHAQASGRTPPTLDDEAREQLRAYRWPGNVRELQNCLERAAILAEGDTIDASHIWIEDSDKPIAPSSDVRPLVEMEKEAILHARRTSLDLPGLTHR